MGETCQETHITLLFANCVLNLIFPQQCKLVAMAIGLSNWESTRRLGLKMERDVI